jgi:hypothetical protein
MINGVRCEDQLGDRDGIRGRTCEHDAKREQSKGTCAQTLMRPLESGSILRCTLSTLCRGDTLRRWSMGISALRKQVAAGCGPAAV